MWPNLQETADLLTFTEEILNRKLHFLCSERLDKAQRLDEKIGVIWLVIKAQFLYFLLISAKKLVLVWTKHLSAPEGSSSVLLEIGVVNKL